ncbi:uncharacterized protein LOC120316029 isoform X2 [Crotalus tigris]|nr:uncharacterized protein LOC120316029 isoform X2 [Crotalus tigris]
MKEENDLPQPFLLDEEGNELKLVCRSSYLKKLWGLRYKNQCYDYATVLWHKIKSGIKNNVFCSSHQYTITLPPIKRLTWAFILVVLVVLLFCYYQQCIHLGTMCPPSIVHAKGDNTEAVPKNLTVPILLEAKKSEPFCEAVDNCFDKAIKEFMSEPRILQENAKMILECNGTRKEFVSGKGENHIEVFWVDGQTHYQVRETNSQVYVARLGRQHLPLSLGSLLNVNQQLASREGSEELRRCLNKTIEVFPKEPQAVQNDAVLEVSCGGSNVTFRSQAGKNEINVYEDHGKIVFNVKSRGWAWWARQFVRH